MMKRKYFSISFLFLLMISTFTPFILSTVIAQTSEIIDLTHGTASAWTNNIVSNANNWLSIVPSKWEDDSGSTVAMGTSVSTVEIGNNPKVQFTLGDLQKLGETNLGVYPTSDGRYVIIKEYTFQVTVGAFTDETITSYLGQNVKNTITIPRDFYHFEWWKSIPRYPVNPSLDKTSPQYADTPGYHKTTVAKIQFNGFNADLKTYNTVNASKTSGKLICSIDINSDLWLPVFKDVNTSGGVLLACNQIYDRILWVQSGNTEDGSLLDGKSKYSIITTASSSTPNTESPSAEIKSYMLPSPISNVTTLLTTWNSIQNTRVGYTIWTWGQVADMGGLAHFTEQSFTVAGQYLSNSSFSTVSHTDAITEGVAEDSQRVIYYPNSKIPVTYTNYRGYDPDTGNVETVEFTVPFSLRPETSVTQYHHKWYYDEKIAQSYITSLSYAGLTSPDYEAWLLQGISKSGVYTQDVVSSWSLSNVYVASTFSFAVQIGAIYSRAEPLLYIAYPYSGLDISNENTDSIFPKVMAEPRDEEQLTALDWLQENLILVIIIVASISLAVVLFLVLRRRKPSVGKSQAPKKLVEMKQTVESQVLLDHHKRRRRN